MKKILSATCAMMLASAGMMANAQQAQTQLPNVGFDTWQTCAEQDGTGGQTYSMNKKYVTRPGSEPKYWNGSSVNQMSLVSEELIKNQEGSALLFNKKVGLGTFTSVAPGYITLGTPWVYATIPVKNSDGGTFGGVSFTYKPDAIKGRYKRTDNTGEASHIIAYLWNGEFNSKISNDEDCVDSDRAIFANNDSNGKLVASCDFTFTGTNNNDWQEIEVPLTYVEGAGDPTKMNVIISAGDYWNRGNLKENTTLLVDDVEFVYYSRLASISLNGEAITLKEGQYDYPVDKVLDFSEDKVVPTVMGKNAEAKVSIDPESASVTVVVSNVDADIDGKLSHKYTFQYNKKETYYSSQLASLKVNDVAVNGFSSDVYSYYVAGEVPAIEKVEAVAVDPEATIEMTRDEETATITIVVTNPKGVDEDGESSHTYVLNFQKFYNPVGPKYDGTLTIQLEGGDPTEMPEQSVYIYVKEDGTCTFGLYKFSLGGEVLGDIVVENVAMDTDENGNITYNGEKKDIVLFLMGEPIFADATVTGTEDAAGNLKMTIPVIWKSGIGDAAPVTTINVTFDGQKEGTSGVESVAGDGVKVYAAAGCVVVEGAEGVAQVYTVDGKQVAAEAVNGKTEIALANGLYIVRVGNKVQKVVVK